MIIESDHGKEVSALIEGPFKTTPVMMKVTLSRHVDPARQDLASALRSYGEVKVSELLGAARRARGPPVKQKLNMKSGKSYGK